MERPKFNTRSRIQRIMPQPRWETRWPLSRPGYDLRRISAEPLRAELAADDSLIHHRMIEHLRNRVDTIRQSEHPTSPQPPQQNGGSVDKAA